MENRSSWQKMAVALFDRTTAKLGEDARQLQDAMFWMHRVPAEATLHNAVERDAGNDVGSADPCQHPIVL